MCEDPSDAITHIVEGLRRLTNADVRDGMHAITYSTTWT